MIKIQFKITSIILALALLLTGCGAGNNKDKATIAASEKVEIDYTAKLNEAKKIKIKETAITLGNKKYDIYADDTKVAKVTGKYLNLFGDVFTLTDLNDNVLAKEKQIKRWGIKLNRCAEITDNDDNVLGYIAEETFTKLFSVGYYFHFYDKDKNEIGISDEIKFSLLKKNVFKDTEGNEDYKVNAKIDFLKDTYEIEVLDKSDIPINHAIFMVCIEDAIKDAKEEEEKSKKENKVKTKKKKKKKRT